MSTSSDRQQFEPLVKPNATIGIIGGGQLGQMLAAAAIASGHGVIVLDPTPNCPASRVAEQIVAPYDSVEAVQELARRSDVLTYEFENISAETLREAISLTRVPQGTKALEICQDRLAEKQFLFDAGVPIAAYRPVLEPADLPGAVAEVGYPCVLKTSRGGYDGKGQVVLKDEKDLAAAQELANEVPCVLEQWVNFEREISVIVAGNPQGQYVTFPVAENQHHQNILHRSIVPARISAATQNQAKLLAQEIARKIDLVGVMGVEMFVAPSGEIYVNELAPRPHNSGHYTIEACNLSQFDAHIRGILGWPLPQPELLSPAIMTNLLGQHLDGLVAAIPHHPEWSTHLYGKAEAKTDRKMGHVTQLADAVEDAVRDADTSGVWTTQQ